MLMDTKGSEPQSCPYQMAEDVTRMPVMPYLPWLKCNGMMASYNYKDLWLIENVR